MVVDILSEQSSLPLCGVALLKLFDRRYVELQRSNEGIEPWSESKEEAYIAFVNSEEIYKFLHKLRTVENFQKDTEEMWDDGENEAFLSHQLLGMWEAETAVYRALREHQGHLIPKLLAAVDLKVPPRDADKFDEGRDGFAPFCVKGILLEHLSGCNLFEIVDNFPRSSWQGIVDQAIAIVRILDDNGIMNKDGTPMNFIVSKPVDACDERQFHVYMIDFALCRFRATDESVAEWNREKSTWDEEGAVGLRMKKALAEHGFELRLEESRLCQKYDRWADRDGSGDSRLVRVEVRPGKFMWFLPSPSKES